MSKIYEFEAVIKKGPNIDGAYIEIPFDVKAEFGKGRVPITAIFDGEKYQGSLVKMGTPCHIIGIRKDIRAKIDKQPGDIVKVTITERQNSMRESRIYKMSFSSVYPLYVAKVEKKGRSKSEVDEIIRWLTGYDQKQLETQLEKEVDFETFFAEAPKLNPARTLITGVICGVRVEDVKEPLMKEIRYLDKMIDGLAKGKVLEKILRKE